MTYPVAQHDHSSIFPENVTKAKKQYSILKCWIVLSFVPIFPKTWINYENGIRQPVTPSTFCSVLQNYNILLK